MSDSDESPSPEDQPAVDPMSSAKFSDDTLVNSSLRRLLDETSDLIDSPTFSHVLTRLLDVAFAHLVDYHVASEAFNATRPFSVPLGGAEPRVTEIADTKCKLAHILPVFCRQAHTIAVGSDELGTIAGVAAQEALGNEYLAAVDRVGDLEAFAAVIYSSNFEYEIPEADKSASLPDGVGQWPAAQDLSESGLVESLAPGVSVGLQPRGGIQSALDESEVLVSANDTALDSAEPDAPSQGDRNDAPVLDEAASIVDEQSPIPNLETAGEKVTAGQDAASQTPTLQVDKVEKETVPDGNTTASEAIAMH